MLSSVSPTEVVFVCPPSSPWNPASFSVELTLSTSCSRSDPSLSRQGRLSLTSHDLVIWTDGSVTFPFVKSGSGVLANSPLRFPFPQAQCLSSSAEACAIVQALSWSHHHQQVSQDSCSAFRFTSNCLAHLVGTVFPPLPPGYNGSLHTCVFRTTANE